MKYRWWIHFDPKFLYLGLGWFCREGCDVISSSRDPHRCLIYYSYMIFTGCRSAVSLKEQFIRTQFITFCPHFPPSCLIRTNSGTTTGHITHSQSSEAMWCFVWNVSDYLLSPNQIWKVIRSLESRKQASWCWTFIFHTRKDSN